MTSKPTREALERKIKQLEKEIRIHKRKEAALHTKQTELVTILENSPTMMLLVDKDKRIKSAANAVGAFSGQRTEEILGRRGGEALSGEFSKRGLGLTSMRERVALSGGTFQIESHKGTGTTVRASWDLKRVPSS